MFEHDLKPNKGAKFKKQRRGRGDGSGRGNFSGRGMKGQSARSGGRRRPGFEGGQTPLYRKMPKLKGFKNPNAVAYQVINLASLEVFEDGTTVTRENLIEKNLIQKNKGPVKLLGNGDLKKKLTVIVDKASHKAQEKAAKAGITVQLPAEEKKAETEKEA